MRHGVRVGVDVGTARIGLARSDPHGMLATPVETVSRDQSGSLDVVRIAAVVAELDAIEVVVGLPLALSGNRTASTNDAVGFAELLARTLSIPVRLVDERLSTVAAQSVLRAAGRKARTQRPVVDQVAATIILQHALDTERALGTPPGSAVAPTEGPPQ
ncbi:Holliday junction resolvase RuvX [Cryobacterium sp. TMT1-21]|uniref:Putative pre-16S rRNA nuclease n=1 Tax=Cryobacterium shii TaxID=1259235 RepID=A0AAQ2HGV4_9MICO|nr:MULTISPECIES: Holliday junction resolvase RuvX [Cryobacterium]TFC51670.1 Holliday junction resolvase RuvX [Cryobacterium shii]TFC83664.1 Holliday junction resolvase RuvX [Cryobacterium sp. TmT2-59]TFD13637.1 Holliday junction resolvase RuvX [Cryobacterium sp. TMT4-10]TFD16000.1 Holliday junction resolvase RuvX [Cryobacterium sp. TMT1-21]TFD27091.1 Holliday junction resolvase RuvX [Cryobacterium sp. TMT2-23]